MPAQATGNNTQVDLYYDIDNPNNQVSRPTGNYTAPLTPVTNTVTNPQNVQPNTNLGGGGGGHSRNNTPAERVDIYYTLTDTGGAGEQVTKPQSNYGLAAKPVVNPSYSVAGTPTSQYILDPAGSGRIALETTTPINTYSYSIDPYSVQPNKNEKTLNPKYSFSDVGSNIFYSTQGQAYEKTYTSSGKEVFTTTDKIGFQSYLDIKASNLMRGAYDKFEKPVLDFAFTNVRTGKVESNALAYKFLTTEIPFSATRSASLMLITPYMSTGTQTYRNIFGGSTVKSSNSITYLSPMEKLNIPQTMRDLNLAQYKSTGREVFKSGDDIFIQQSGIKTADSGFSLTTSTTRVTPTGVNRLAGFTKGQTDVFLNSMSGNTFSYSNPFTFTSRVTDISNAPFSLTSSGVTRTYEGAYWGKLSGIYYQEGATPISVTDKIVLSSADKGFSKVASFDIISKNNIPINVLSKNGITLINQPSQISSNNLRLLGVGKIYDMDYSDDILRSFTGGGSVNIGSSGTKNIMLFDSGSVGTATASRSALASDLSFSSSASVGLKQTQTYTSAQAFQWAYNTGLLGVTSSGQTNKYKYSQSYETALITSLDFSKSLKMAPLGSETITIPKTNQNYRLATAQTSITNLSQIQIPETVNTFRPGFSTGVYSYPTPNINITGFPIALLSGFNNDDNIYKTLRGGKRNVAYTPSASALLFNISGKYKAGKLSKSGLDFRPVTNAFKIKIGGLLK